MEIEVTIYVFFSFLHFFFFRFYSFVYLIIIFSSFSSFVCLFLFSLAFDTTNTKLPAKKKIKWKKENQINSSSSPSQSLVFFFYSFWHISSCKIFVFYKLTCILFIVLACRIHIFSSNFFFLLLFCINNVMK